MEKVSRRNVLQGAVAVAASALIEMPSAKQTRPASLTARGEPERYSGNDLNFIGMPIGGCFAGTVYLGGDGQLWNWDIFNQGQLGAVSKPGVVFMGDNLNESGGANYVRPSHQISPFKQRFDLHTNNGATENRAIPTGLGVKFGHVTFRGEYPVAKVEYRQADADLKMDLEAFSPFIPLDIDSSSHPATTLTFRVRNTGKNVAECSLRYRFENPALIYSRKTRDDFDLIETITPQGVEVSARPKSATPSNRADQIFEDWSSGQYGDWKTTGTAFGKAPRKVSELPGYMGNIEAGTTYVVNTHETRSGENVVQGDSHKGTLKSKSFTIDRDWINVRVGGGNHPGQTCINLVIDGKVVRTLTGHDENRMMWKSMSVKPFQGSEATLEIVDSFDGPWGQIGIGEIVFSDAPRSGGQLDTLPDFGNFAVQVLDGAKVTKDGGFYTVASDFSLKPGEVKEVTFLIGWWFPNNNRSMPGKRHWYANKWTSASNALDDIRKNWPRLRDTTRLWNKTWYDSTLPFWFLDRTFINTSTLATTTCNRFDEGRFYFMEGIGCCAGTCTHVWGYAQAIARIFPEVERYLRESVDYGFAFRPNGAIDYRGEYGQSVAHDGQASCVMRFYREHLMSKDDRFLKQHWSKVKKSLEFLINEDKDKDGILEGAQYNTLDAAWYGPMAWLSSLYIGALRAGEKMATLMGDGTFASQCQTLAESGSKKLVSDLYNGEYFIHKPDPAHPEANNTNDGCHIDQLYGQFWAAQLGLPRIVGAKEGKSAMAALFKHNFYADIWDYRSKVRGVRGGRWYAIPGEGGLIMCTFPRGGSERATGKGGDAWAAAYFNECMSGFEYQAAANMISEGLVKEGLTVIRAIHDRYQPGLRNPYNEVECSDHYGRAMASFGAYVAITGMYIDSPNKVVTIAPKVNGGKAKCAFVDAHGWGTIDNRIGETVREYAYRA